MIKMKYGVKINEAEWYVLQKYYQDTYPKKMAVVANRVRSRMINSMKRKSYTSKGKKPAPSTPGTPPHSISQPSSSDKKKKFYRMRVVKYEKMGRLKYAVGVAPFADGGKHTMEVPGIQEKGGTINRVGNKYHGNKIGQRHKITRKQKDAFLRRMRRGFANQDEKLLRSLLIWRSHTAAHYPRRAYLEPAARKARRELQEAAVPTLFQFVRSVK